MNHTDTTANVSGFLSVVCEQSTPSIRSESDFFTAFPPALLMERIEDVEVRAMILNKASGTHLEIARRMSKSNAAEQLGLALEHSLVKPEDVLAFLNGEQRVRFLDRQDLWQFVVETKFWQGDESDTVRVTHAREMFACMLDTALEHMLIAPEEIVQAIGYELLFSKESTASLIQTIKAMAQDRSANPFELMLGRCPPKRFVAAVNLNVMWDEVIHPLIAVRHGLISMKEQSERIEPKVEAVVSSGSTDAASDASGSAPPPVVKTSDSTKRTSSSSSLIAGIPSLQGPTGVSASSIPAAHRVNKGGDPSDPKDGKASDASVSGVEGDGERVRDSEISIEVDVHVSDTSADQGVAETAGAYEEPEVTCSDPLASAPIALVRIATPPPFPAVPKPPRPAPDSQRIQIDPGMELEVERIRSTDPEVVAALEIEASSGRVPEDTAYISDGAFAEAGGSTRMSSRPSLEEEPSITPMDKKTALGMFLRSDKVGLPLENVNIFECRLQEILVTALMEIDPDTYANARERLESANEEGLGMSLHHELSKRNPLSAIELRSQLIEMGCIPKPSVTPARPPPLPPLKGAIRRDPTGQHRR